MTTNLRILGLSAELSALFHDVGKATDLFQDKLHSCLKKDRRDLVRHEIVSAYMFNALVNRQPDVVWLTLLTQPGLAKILDDAFEKGLLDLKKDLKNISGGLGRRPLRIEVNNIIHRTIWWLIATHHRMLTGVGKFEQYDYSNHHNDKSDTNPTKFQQPKKIVVGGVNTVTNKKNTQPCKKISQHDGWVQAIRNCASSLLAAIQSPDYQPDINIGLPGFYSYARPALILGDHAGSQHVSYDTLPFPSAKSFSKKEQSPKRISVPQHNLDVYKHTGISFNALSTHSLPGITTLPPRIIEKSDNQRFFWQNTASDKIQNSDLEEDHGFFGVVLGGTGRGKTIALVKIMSGLRNNPRFTVTNPLRSLTLQTGTAYCDDVGFKKSDVYVKIGSPVINSLYDINRSGSNIDDVEKEDDAEDQNEVGTSKYTLIDDQSTTIPVDENATVPQLSGFFTDFVSRHPENKQDDLSRYLGAPILIATVDSLMGVSAGFKTSRMEHALRLLTSDLIIDEIDSFSEKDQAAIARLVYVAGTYGRKVIISSATVPAATAEAFYRAYARGYKEYALLHGTPNIVGCGWFPDEPDLVHVEPNMDGQSFVNKHNEIITNVVKRLIKRDPLRKAEILQVSHCQDPDNFFETVWQGCHHQHQNFHISHDGVNISFGFVRWANIDATRNFARYVSNKQSEQDTLHKIICYHSRHMLAIRNEIEVFLDRVCNRKNGIEPLLDDENVKRALVEAKEKGLTNLMLIVICSPILEIGRDYDFDWNIIDPSGLRMLVQAYGRLGRHSNTHGCITGLVLSEPYRAMKNRWNNSQSTKPAFMYPGVEDEYEPRWRLFEQNGDFITEAEKAFNMAIFRSAVDARDCLLQPDQYDNPIGWLEHDKLQYELINSEISVCNWFEGSILARMTNRHQKACTFRYNDKSSLYVWRIETDQGDNWKKSLNGDPPSDANCEPASEGNVFLLSLNSRDIFARLSKTITHKDNEKDLCGFEFLFGDVDEIEYSDQLGGGDKKKSI